MTTDTSMTTGTSSDFYIVSREPGHVEHALPVWASRTGNTIVYAPEPPADCHRVHIPNVPGAFRILNLLSDTECDQFIAISDTLGFHDDAPVSLPRHIRHNTNVNWVVDESVDGPLWERSRQFFATSTFSGLEPVGLNARFRFYRYGPGDYFAAHTDGAWPGSRVRNGELVTDAYGDRVSEITFLMFLSDGYEGGRTLFQVTDPETGETAVFPVATPKGAALCFPHGRHPDHCLHAGETIVSQFKYIIRSDVLYG